MGFGPHVADLNGDGHRDVISGSYPGEIYVFAGDGEGGFRKGETLKDVKREVIRIGRATVVFVVDWEGDGDLDIVSGDIDGKVHLLRNGAGGKGMAFSKAEPVKAACVPITAPGRNSGPVVADWDGDGRRDLLLGCGDGSVLFFRNTAKEGEPILARPAVLVPRSKYWYEKSESRSPSGMRSKLAVADWNGDGRLDLLVGDYFSTEGKAPPLTNEQKKRRDELQKEADALREEMRGWSDRIRKMYATHQERARKEMGLPEGKPLREVLAGLDPNRQGEFGRLVRKYLEEDPEYAPYHELLEKNRKLYEELSKYLPRRESHGMVWLYARKGAERIAR